MYWAKVAARYRCSDAAAEILLSRRQVPPGSLTLWIFSSKCHGSGKLRQVPVHIAILHVKTGMKFQMYTSFGDN